MTTSITRRCGLAAALAACCVSLSGCHKPTAYAERPPSEAQWLKPPLFEEQAYDEAVSGFMTTADHKKLIVLGRPFHFILDLPDALRSTLSSGYGKSLRWTLVGFRAAGGHVKGHYRVVLPRDTSAGERLTAAANGFIDAKDGLALEGDIGGMRYSTRDFDVPSQVAAHLLERPYTIYARHVTRAIVGLNLAVQATPITATADGELVLDGVALVPVELAVIQAPRG